MQKRWICLHATLVSRIGRPVWPYARLVDLNSELLILLHIPFSNSWCIAELWRKLSVTGHCAKPVPSLRENRKSGLCRATLSYFLICNHFLFADNFLENRFRSIFWVYIAYGELFLYYSML